MKNKIHSFKKEHLQVDAYINSLTKLVYKASEIPNELYGQYKVNRGLRDMNGNGVLTGLTEISEIVAFKYDNNGFKIPTEGELYYRGYDIHEIVRPLLSESRFGFEEVVYLLILGKLPNKKELSDFKGLLNRYRSLPTDFVKDIIMKAPSRDMMNTLSRSVLTLFSYDKFASNTKISNVLRQSLMLTSVMPLISVYGYFVYASFIEGEEMFINEPRLDYSIAQNILHMLRKDSKFSQTEAKVLDIALILHAEHGGGNNSTFTTRVVSSSGTDTYSAISAALGSLKGPKHGGANIKVSKMFDHIKKTLKDWDNEEEIENCLDDILKKKTFDKQGLIYGMGHAVYSISDPRAEIFKRLVKRLAKDKGMLKEYNLYSKIERISTDLISREKNIYKGVAANIDFYTGFVYSMLGIPTKLYTPLFAIARIAGWSAHRLEELVGGGKIIRPAYMSVQSHNEYIELDKR